MKSTPLPANTEPAWRRWDAHVAAVGAAIDVRIHGVAPPAVARHARLIFMDTLGCALAGRQAAEVAALEARLAVLEPGAFSFPGGCGLGLRPAAQIMAIAATWHEACEGHAFAHGRPGIPAIAVLLPLALRRNSRLGEFIDALALGYEVGARAGAWLRLSPGIHADGNWPGLGVAAGMAKLLGLDAAQTKHAVNIAACQLPNSLYLPIRTGCSVRNGYLAHSAMLGLDAALAAQAGFDAPPDALGYYAEHYCPASREALPPASADLLPDAYLKPFAAVRHVHYGALAARRIREQVKGDTGRIGRIMLSIYEEAAVYCGNPHPATPLSAQFSLSFGVAAILRYGDIDASSYEPPKFNDPELCRLEALVSVRIDPQLTRESQRGASLVVDADGGSWAETVSGDDPSLLLAVEGAIVKFVRNAACGVPAEMAHRFCHALLDADADVSLVDLWNLLGRAETS